MVGMGFSARSLLPICCLASAFSVLYPAVSRFFRCSLESSIIVTIAIVICFWNFSLYDYIQLNEGTTGGDDASGPEFLKKRIHRIIRKRSNALEEDNPGDRLVSSCRSFSSGFVVSILESTCTARFISPRSFLSRMFPP